MYRLVVDGDTCPETSRTTSIGTPVSIARLACESASTGLRSTQEKERTFLISWNRTFPKKSLQAMMMNAMFYKVIYVK